VRYLPSATMLRMLRGSAALRSNVAGERPATDWVQFEAQTFNSIPNAMLREQRHSAGLPLP